EGRLFAIGLAISINPIQRLCHAVLKQYEHESKRGIEADDNREPKGLAIFQPEHSPKGRYPEEE
ncbi:MAG TPA: hypothetical protein PLT48_15815, partial [Nitrospira sp.]|nr:hypothetical protein [Nitrospira sp.]